MKASTPFFRTLDGPTSFDDFMGALASKAALFLKAGYLVNDVECKEAHTVPQESIDQFNELCRQGKSVRAIAKETGWAATTVKRHTLETRKKLGQFRPLLKNRHLLRKK